MQVVGRVAARGPGDFPLGGQQRCPALGDRQVGDFAVLKGHTLRLEERLDLGRQGWLGDGDPLAVLVLHLLQDQRAEIDPAQRVQVLVGHLDAGSAEGILESLVLGRAGCVAAGGLEHVVNDHRHEHDPSVPVAPVVLLSVDSTALEASGEDDAGVLVFPHPRGIPQTVGGCVEDQVLPLPRPREGWLEPGADPPGVLALD